MSIRLHKTSKYSVFGAGIEVTTPTKGSSNLVGSSRPTKSPKDTDLSLTIEPVAIDFDKTLNANGGNHSLIHSFTHLITCFKGTSDETNTGGGGGQVVDPWTVESDNAIDYDKLIRDFGSQPLTQDIIDRMEKLTGKKPHRFLR